MRHRRPAPRRAAATALAALGLAVPILAGCAVAPPVAGALPPTRAATPASPSAVAGGAGGHVPAASAQAAASAAPAPPARAAQVAGADLASGEGTAITSVAGLGALGAPAAPGTASARGPAAYATVLAYLSAVVALRRTGDEAAFLALTTARCTCRSMRGEAVARARVGGVRGFDVRVVRAVEVDPVDTLRTVIEVDLVIPRHTDPAAPGLPGEQVPQARPHLALLVDFRGGTGRVDAVLRRAEQGGAR